MWDSWKHSYFQVMGDKELCSRGIIECFNCYFYVMKMLVWYHLNVSCFTQQSSIRIKWAENSRKNQTNQSLTLHELAYIGLHTEVDDSFLNDHVSIGGCRLITVPSIPAALYIQQSPRQLTVTAHWFSMLLIWLRSRFSSILS